VVISIIPEKTGVLPFVFTKNIYYIIEPMGTDLLILRGFSGIIVLRQAEP